MTRTLSEPLILGQAVIHPVVREGFLESLGSVTIAGCPVRDASVRFLPWFDTFEGEVFRRFRFNGVRREGERVILDTTAVSDPDVVFRERRDSSGDLVFRDRGWDAKPLEVAMRIVMEPTQLDLGQRRFTGFTYHIEVEGDLPVHRILDRQTWEVGGRVDGVNVCLRNWSHEPMVPLTTDKSFSSGGLVNSFVVAFPGNLWARWSMFPAFDFQYRKGDSGGETGGGGVLMSCFEEVSLIRSLAESGAGEGQLRQLDLHLFKQDTKVKTNAKSILFSPEPVDDIAAANLWTAMYDREQQRARAQFGIPDEDPPYISFDKNVWVGFKFEESFNDVLDVAAEFSADYVFIDPVWENEQSWQESVVAALGENKDKSEYNRMWFSNMCNTLDFRVTQHRGGEAGLKRYIDRARAKGVNVMSWVCSHASVRTALGVHKGQADGNGKVEVMGKGPFGVFASRESGRHPDTGYASDAWSLNLHAPIADYVRDRVIETCQATGLKGFLWDSFSNIGWWHIDYANGDMAPQFHRQAQLYAAWRKAGIHLRPEGLPIFSSHCGLGMAAGNLYTLGIQATYGYDLEVPFDDHIGTAERLLTGKDSTNLLFQWIANRHMPSLHFHHIPREKWNAAAVEKIKALLRTYKLVRGKMKQRTILGSGDTVTGIAWSDGTSERVVFTFTDQPRKGEAVDAMTGQAVTGATLPAYGVYRVRA